jgi:hypothetical protein
MEPEELESVCHGCDPGLFRRQLEACGLSQIIGQRGFLRECLFLRPGYQHHKVVGIAYWQEDAAPRVSTMTRDGSDGLIASVLVATDRLSWIRAWSFSSPILWPPARHWTAE